VNLGFSHDMAFASVAGTGEILHDRDKLEQLWGIGTQAWSDKDETPPEHLQSRARRSWWTALGLMEAFLI